MYKRSLHFILTILISLGVLAAIILIKRDETAYLFESLYIRKSLLRAGTLYSTIIRRLTMTVILYVIGIASIFLSIITQEYPGFLRLSRVSMAFSVIVVSLWDYNMISMLQVTQRHRFLWSWIGDLGHIVCLLSVLSIAAEILATVQETRVIQWLNLAAGLLLSIADLSLLPYQGRFVLLFLGIYGSGIIVFYLLRVIRTAHVKSEPISRNRIFQHLLVILYLALADAAVWLISVYKFRPLADLYRKYLDIFPLLGTIYVIVLFLQYFYLHQQRMLAGKEATTRLYAMTQYREELTQLMVTSCEPPVQKMTLYAERMTDPALDEHTRNDLLESMQRELSQLAVHLGHLDDYQFIRNQRSAADLIKTSLYAVLHYAANLPGEYVPRVIFEDRPEMLSLGANVVTESAATEDAMTDNAETEDADVQGKTADIYVKTDPYLMIQVLGDIFKNLGSMSAAGEIHASCRTDDTSAHLIFETALTPSGEREFKRLQATLRDRISNFRPLRETDTVYIAIRDKILSCNGEIQAVLSRTGEDPFGKVEITIPIYLDPQPEAIPVAADDPDKKRIALISAQTEQIELVYSYLLNEPYVFHAFTTGEDAVKYLEGRRNVGVVILGSMFMTASMEDVCKQIRGRYTSEQLPILLVTHRGMEDHIGDLLPYINDLISEPFSQAELLRRLQILMTVQHSAMESIKTRLDFLQSQINPHFIFNTLSGIMPLCIQEPEKAYEMLSNFSEYLRGRLYKRELQRRIPVYEELDLIEAYLSIEQMRFPGQIEYEIRNGSSENAKIMPLLLEPIVENCAQHGKKTGEVLHILVSVQERDGFLYCLVRDDGIGMAPEKVREILESDVETSKNDSIGIYNVRRRLLLYCNEIMQIRSEPGKLTETSFRIPLENEK